jgi:hypothetical protein
MPLATLMRFRAAKIGIARQWRLLPSCRFGLSGCGPCRSSTGTCSFLWFRGHIPFHHHFADNPDSIIQDASILSHGFREFQKLGPTSITFLVSALTVVGGQAIGARALIEGIVRVTDLFGNETARNWAAPVLGAVTIGLTAYFVCEVPNSIPRMVGRRIKGSLGVGHVDGEGNQEGVEDRFVGSEGEVQCDDGGEGERGEWGGGVGEEGEVCV